MDKERLCGGKNGRFHSSRAAKQQRAPVLSLLVVLSREGVGSVPREIGLLVLLNRVSQPIDTKAKVAVRSGSSPVSAALRNLYKKEPAMAVDYIVILLKNLAERKRVMGLQKAKREALRARRYLANVATSSKDVLEVYEWGKRNSDSIAAALEAGERDEWS